MPKLIKYILCILFVAAIGDKSYAQFRGRIIIQRRNPMDRVVRQGPPQRRLEQIKESYIERRINLNVDQSRAFWPLYRQYVEEQTAVRILKRENNSDNSPNGTAQIDNELKYETELVNIRKHYRDEFLKILSPDQLSMLYKSEREFNDEMVKQLGERAVNPVN
jgi:hypothetical protein